MAIQKIEAKSYIEAKKKIEDELNSEIIDMIPKRKYLIFKYFDVYYAPKNKNTAKGIKLDFNETTSLANIKNAQVKKNTEPEEIDEIKEKVRDMDEKLDAFISEIKFAVAKDTDSDIITSIKYILIKSGVLEDVADELIKQLTSCMTEKQLKDKNKTILKMAEILSNIIRTKKGFNFNYDKNVGPKKIMMIGPTGVGKTTTIGKLTGKFFKEGKKIALITLDTFRIGATKQLAEYGEILHIPVNICNTLEEIQESLVNFMDKDIVLIDTTGRSQKTITCADESDEVMLDAIDLIDPDELVLTVSATTKTEDMLECVEKFSLFDVTSIIMTKLDETNTLGDVVNICYKYPKTKIAYFTNGQIVPDDIEEASPEQVAKKIILKN